MGAPVVADRATGRKSALLLLMSTEILLETNRPPRPKEEEKAPKGAVGTAGALITETNARTGSGEKGAKEARTAREKGSMDSGPVVLAQRGKRLATVMLPGNDSSTQKII